MFWTSSLELNTLYIYLSLSTVFLFFSFCLTHPHSLSHSANCQANKLGGPCSRSGTRQRTQKKALEIERACTSWVWLSLLDSTTLPHPLYFLSFTSHTLVIHPLVLWFVSVVLHGLAFTELSFFMSLCPKVMKWPMLEHINTRYDQKNSYPRSTPPFITPMRKKLDLELMYNVKSSFCSLIR